ncbi:unnamed protein product [Lathyrus oleraceus]|uniref:GATA transcription factor 9-like n=1 Tax=Pisum sativum TaxID=3888 RepID=UPI0021D2D4C1|nr:GATA transcription factor 9-like [Pisum sativum]
MVSSLATPLWRQGPPNKPVLCNACGSRYRLKGNLDNYFPKHCLPKELGCRNDVMKNLKFVYKRKTPMEKFHDKLLNELKYEDILHESSLEEVLLFENVNNFIPSNEIGVGAILLKPDDITEK